jgi:hypothetical protein
MLLKKSSAPKGHLVRKATNPGLNCEAQQLTIGTMRWLLALASILFPVTVYRQEGSPQLQAIYFDNEGHVIRYSVKILAGGGVAMESGGPPSASRYRMTYISGGPDRLKIKFEIAPPGKDFAGYIDATARREGSEARP